MICSNCGSPLSDESKFCTSCGTPVTAQPAPEAPVYEAPAQPVPEAPVYEAPVQPAPETPVYEAPVQQPMYTPAYHQAQYTPSRQSAPKQITEADLPEQYRPLSPWAYWGLQILYAVPIVGFIFMIIFSFKKSNINRRNFTRSYFCTLFLVLIVAVTMLVIVVLTRGTPRAVNF